MRILLLLLALTLPGWAQPLVQELTLEETTRWSQSLSRAAFPDHDCVSLSHFVRLLRVNGKLHGLALHQANLHSGHCSWMHYLWDGSRWKPIGPGLPDPRSDDNLVLPEPNGQDIQQHFPGLVQGLLLQEWPKSVQLQLLQAPRIREL